MLRALVVDDDVVSIGLRARRGRLQVETAGTLTEARS
jgi:hypothetical protein